MSNLNPILARLEMLTEGERQAALWILDIISECGWPEVPNRAVWELKLKERRENRVKGKG